MADQFSGKIIAEKYRVDELIRNDSLGLLYRGWHLFMDKPLTLKILSAEMAADETIRQRFSAEARNAVLVSHPNILAVSDFGTAADNSVYIVFEGFEGETLQDTIRRSGKLTVARTTALVSQIAAVLTAYGEKGVSHGKLNSENILVASAPAQPEIVKVFGLNGDGDELLKRDIYNVAYQAPEQFLPGHSANAATDVYNLGIVAFQMLAGRVPFSGDTPTDIMLKHTEETPPTFAATETDVPAAIEAVIKKALEKKPESRYQTALEFSDELTKATNPVAKENNLWKTAFVVLIGISLLGAAMIYLTRSNQTDPATQLQADEKGRPVQPINPATGAEEQRLAAMSMTTYDPTTVDAMGQPPGTLPGGDGYNAWGNGGAPPPGAPQQNYIPPGGQVYTVDPNSGSQFMPNDSGVILVPVPADSVKNPKPTPTPKPAKSEGVDATQPTTVKPNVPTKTAPQPANKVEPAKPADKPKEAGNKKSTAEPQSL